MKPSPFTIHRPTSVEQTLELLSEFGAHGKIIAGGQSLVPVLNMRLAAPEHLIDITAVSGLSDIVVHDGDVEVGALVSHARLEHDERAHAAQPVLRAALKCVAHPAIRNRGTTVGSLAHADPNGEMPMILALTGGHVDVVSSRGTRSLEAAELNVGPLETCLESDELIVKAVFGGLAPGQSADFAELTRRTGDYALAGVGMVLSADPDTGELTGLRAGFVSVTDLPDILDLGGVVAGTQRAEAAALVPTIAQAVEEFVDPVGDIHATADYRRHLAGVMAGRVFTGLISGAVPGRETEEAA
ncbi:FAD binding domain-containing protein [Brevibacterium moorei]|uniref:FAD binding domain-containing protein n=1 Tax=Brevibacterium moorei TaxID=2968457 RepID=UPI00211C6DE7|nr:FAD binding domain-containing protein [Brevibacterium sp. 68QC2CO]MCQ9386187.1 FAD binding domain-containing protein [Brevibacterium sp. 68QC2CO]